MCIDYSMIMYMIHNDGNHFLTLTLNTLPSRLSSLSVSSHSPDYSLLTHHNIHILQFYLSIQS